MGGEAAGADQQARAAYLVLGMHRSGTSALTRILDIAGARLPKNLMPGDAHNQKGYFEPWRIALFNDERLRAAGGAWDDVFGFPHRALPRAAERRWLVRAEDLFREEYGAADNPLLKDPRITVLLPFWRTVFDDLQLAPRCVIPVRHPAAVAGSLERRDGFTPQKSLLLWTAYMLAAEAYTRDLPRVFVDYDLLLADWRPQLARLEAGHGATLPKLDERAAKAIDRFLTPELRHNEAAAADLAQFGWAGELAAGVYDAVRAAALDQPLDTAALAQAAEALERRRKDIGPLVSSVSRDLDAVRTDLRETRARLEAEIGRLEGAIAEVDAARERQIGALRGEWDLREGEIRAAWRRDVGALENDLKLFYRTFAEADAQLTLALAGPQAAAAAAAQAEPERSPAKPRRKKPT